MPEALTAAIHIAVSDPSMHARTEAVGSAIRVEDGVGQAFSIEAHVTQLSHAAAAG